MDVYQLSDEELRVELATHGVSVGPITATTKKLYQKKLLGLLGGGEAPANVTTPPQSPNGIDFADELNESHKRDYPDESEGEQSESDYEESSRVLTPEESYHLRQRFSRGDYEPYEDDEYATSAAPAEKPASTRLVTFALIGIVVFSVLFLYFLNTKVDDYNKEKDEI